MRRPLLFALLALPFAVVAACSVVTPVAEPGVGEDAGSTEAGSAEDSASASDVSSAMETGANAADADAASDAAPSGAAGDAADDAADASDGGACIPGPYFAPYCNSFCLGGCDLALANTDVTNMCRATCGGVCPPDPVFSGVCPPECNLGCADGWCNLDAMSTAVELRPLPALATPGQVQAGKFYPRLVCPEGIPCRVMGAAGAKIFCPTTASCEVNLAASDAHMHVFCGTGRCKVTGGKWNGSLHDPFPLWQYNYAGHVCGNSCDCQIPMPLAHYSPGSGPGQVCTVGPCLGGGCPCNDGQTISSAGGPCGANGHCSVTRATECPVVCAAHGGWADPDPVR